MKEKHETSFKNKKHVAPGTEFHFEPDLIDRLTNDHVKILGALQKVFVTYELNKCKKVRKNLKKFKLIFTKHLVLENLDLYIYLKHSYKKESTKYRKVTEFRKEMRKISKYVITFVENYEILLKQKEKLGNFRKELLGVYLTLKKRFKREEKELFPLYQDRF